MLHSDLHHWFRLEKASQLYGSVLLKMWLTLPVSVGPSGGLTDYFICSQLIPSLLCGAPPSLLDSEMLRFPKSPSPALFYVLCAQALRAGARDFNGLWHAGSSSPGSSATSHRVRFKKPTALLEPKLKMPQTGSLSFETGPYSSCIHSVWCHHHPRKHLARNSGVNLIYSCPPPPRHFQASSPTEFTINQQQTYRVWNLFPLPHSC